MKIKPLKVMTYLFLSLAFGMLPLTNASAMEIISNPSGGVTYGHPQYRILLDSSWTSPTTGEISLGQGQHRIDYLTIYNQDIFRYGHNVIYIRAQGCTFVTGLDNGDYFRFESVKIYDENFLNSADYYDRVNIYELTYRSYYSNWPERIISTEVTVPMYFYCTGDQSYNMIPSFSVISHSAYPPTIDYTAELNEVRRLLQEIIDKPSDSAGEVLEDQREEDRQDMEDAQGDAEDAGQDAGQAVTEETGDMINLVGGIIGAITDTNATNCNVTANWGNLNLGQLNLCSAPQEIRAVLQTVLGVIGVIVVLNTVHYLVDTVYNMTKEVQDT